MRLLLPVLLLILGLGGGVAGGLVFAPAPPPEPEADADPDSEGEQADAGADPEDEASAPDGDAGFVRMSNQFVVPVVRDGRVRSIVVVSLSIEMVGADANARVFALEPRLRDEFLQVMFAHANAGGFDGHFTATAALAPLRQGLREAARAILGPQVTDVLIIDIARQDA